MSIASILLVVPSIPAHELGHYRVARLLGYPATITMRWRPFPYPVVRVPLGGRSDSVKIALAGPAAQTVYGLVVAVVYPLAGLACMAVALLSLIPIRPQDGWHVWRALRGSP